jgi:hypothetical protein
MPWISVPKQERHNGTVETTIEVGPGLELIDGHKQNIVCSLNVGWDTLSKYDQFEWDSILFLCVSTVLL